MAASIRGISLRVYRVLLLFSGHRREEDIEHWLVRLAAEAGAHVKVDCADLAYGQQWDLRQEENVERTCAMARAGHWDFGHGAPPCATWSAALYANQDGPPPLRSRSHPWGLPHLRGKLRKKLEEANFMMLACLSILAAILSSGGGASMEHPEDRG